jgi:Fe2+ transport system protein FeoA
MRLSELSKGAKGVILSIEGHELELSLLRLGLLVGDRFEVSDIAPFRGPMALKVNGTKVALRLSDAHKVLTSQN